MDNFLEAIEETGRIVNSNVHSPEPIDYLTQLIQAYPEYDGEVSEEEVYTVIKSIKICYRLYEKRTT